LHTRDESLVHETEAEAEIYRLDPVLRKVDTFAEDQKLPKLKPVTFSKSDPDVADKTVETLDKNGF
jgi:hypothetical protein